jgi:hypothetical protein
MITADDNTEDDDALEEDDDALEASSREDAHDPVIDPEFWNDRDSWPIDSKEYVFLARAFDQLGKAKFGDKWIHTKWPKHSPELEGLQDEMVELFRNEVLTLKVRPLEGGEMKDLHISWWNTEPKTWRRRFYQCQIDPEHPFRDPSRTREAVAAGPQLAEGESLLGREVDAVTGKAASYIYVKRADLEEYLRGEDRTPAETEVNNPLQNAMGREAKDESADLGSRVAELRTKLAQLEKTPAAATKERKSLLKLVIGMAIEGYAYNPTAPRSEKTKKIAEHLRDLGIPLDQDTVHKWLDVAYDEFDNDTMRERLNDKFKKS